MNRDEKNLLTRQKIIDSALAEFSEKSYGEASLNTICSAGNISKGIIYHYFKDKDELYLLCVKECFDSLTEYLSGAVTVYDVPVEKALECYFEARITFFAEHPHYLGVFCSALMNPPIHLSSDIEQIASNLTRQSVSMLTTFLKTVKLRSDIGMEEVILLFYEFQDFVNTRFQRKATGEIELKEHEERCRRSMQILLYGVIEREVQL